MAATQAQIEEQLGRLTPEQLDTVYDFVSFLAERRSASASLTTMLASESVLRRAWDRPEEDTAWSDL
jgi:hypothetical protein